MSNGFGYPPGYNPNQPPHAQLAPQAQAPQGYAPQAPQANYAAPPAGYAPQAQGYAAPAAPVSNVDVLAGIDDQNANDDGEYPHPSPCGGAVWVFALDSMREHSSRNPRMLGQKMVWVTGRVIQSPDPQFVPGQLLSIKIGGFGGVMHLKAQGRLKALVGALCREDFRQAHPAGHIAARIQQAFSGQLAGQPFAVSITTKWTPNNPNYQIPNFMPVQG